MSGTWWAQTEERPVPAEPATSTGTTIIPMSTVRASRRASMLSNCRRTRRTPIFSASTMRLRHYRRKRSRISVECGRSMPFPNTARKAAARMPIACKSISSATASVASNGRRSPRRIIRWWCAIPKRGGKPLCRPGDHAARGRDVAGRERCSSGRNLCARDASGECLRSRLGTWRLGDVRHSGDAAQARRLGSERAPSHASDEHCQLH